MLDSHSDETRVVDMSATASLVMARAGQRGRAARLPSGSAKIHPLTALRIGANLKLKSRAQNAGERSAELQKVSDRWCGWGLPQASGAMALASVLTHRLRRIERE